jgi:hypothetical protein
MAGQNTLLEILSFASFPPSATRLLEMRIWKISSCLVFFVSRKKRFCISGSFILFLRRRLETGSKRQFLLLTCWERIETKSSINYCSPLSFQATRGVLLRLYLGLSCWVTNVVPIWTRFSQPWAALFHLSKVLRRLQGFHNLVFQSSRSLELFLAMDRRDKTRSLSRYRVSWPTLFLPLVNIRQASFGRFKGIGPKPRSHGIFNYVHAIIICVKGFVRSSLQYLPIGRYLDSRWWMSFPELKPTPVRLYMRCSRRLLERWQKRVQTSVFFMQDLKSLVRLLYLGRVLASYSLVRG